MQYLCWAGSFKVLHRTAATGYTLGASSGFSYFLRVFADFIVFFRERGSASSQFFLGFGDFFSRETILFHEKHNMEAMLFEKGKTQPVLPQETQLYFPKRKNQNCASVRSPTYACIRSTVVFSKRTIHNCASRKEKSTVCASR